jgi:hypothetical protein
VKGQAVFVQDESLIDLPKNLQIDPMKFGVEVWLVGIS